MHDTRIMFEYSAIKKKREPHAAVFREEARDQFAFRFRQIERQPVGFGHGGDQKDDKGDELRKGQGIKGKPVPEPAGLGFGDFDQAQTARQQ